MTLKEFQSWFEGFTDGKESLSAEEIKRVIEKLESTPVEVMPGLPCFPGLPYFPNLPYLEPWHPYKPYWQINPPEPSPWTFTSDRTAH